MTGEARRSTLSLLRWFGVDEAVIGDLQEACGGNQNGWWFWRQTVGAVYITVVADLRTHPLSVVACIGVGWLTVWEVAPALIRVTIAAAIRSYDRSYFANGGLPPPHSGDFIWMLNFAILIFTNTAGGFAAVRWHKGQRRLFALLFAATVVGQRMFFFIWYSTAYDPSTASLYFVFRPTGATVITLVALESMAALAGGFAAARRREVSVR